MRSLSAILAVTAGGAAAGAAAPCKTPLLTPQACCSATAPATFEAAFHTTAGDFSLHVERAWAPLGVDRFYNMLTCGYLGNGTAGSYVRAREEARARAARPGRAPAGPASPSPPSLSWGLPEGFWRRAAR